MKYYVITDNGVTSCSKLKQLNKKLDLEFDESEFKTIGSDKIVKIVDSDIEFLADKRRMSIIPIKNLYKKDNTNFYLLLGILVVNFIILVRG